MRIHRIAALGNSIAVILIVLVAAGGGQILMGPRPPEAAAPGRFDPAPAGSSGRARARRLILVVVDGLRADTAFDAELMPTLHRLAMGGGRTTARVESLVPSSIAGIIALVSGEVLPPTSSLSDFGASPREEGGVLQAVALSGGLPFVAGPSLWTELYGRWIASAEVDPAFGGADGRLVGAAMRAIESNAHRLIVLHLGRIDEAAHRHGARSPEYRAAVRWSDAVVGRLARAMGPETGLVVTSDHGNADDGGHAGPEPSVLTTPLVMFGPGLPAGCRPEFPQRAVPALLLSALGFDAAVGAPPGSRPRGDRSRITLPMTAAILCGLCFWSGLRGVASGRPQATALNITVWLLLALIVLGEPPAALAAGLAVLAWAACSVRGEISPGLIAATGSGAALGVLRLVDGYVALDHADGTGPALIVAAALAWGALRRPPGGVPSGRRAARPRVRLAARLGECLGVSMGAVAAAGLGRARLLLVYFAAVGLGRALGRRLGSRLDGAPEGSARAASTPEPARDRCLAVGVMTATALVLLGRAAGGTTSLSTVDVRSAFGLVDWPCGLILAMIAVAAAQAIPAVGLLLGLRAAVGRLSADPATDLAGGLAAALVGQSAVGALLLDSGRGQLAASLALGLSVRVIAEALYLFLGLAVLVIASGPVPARRA